MPTDVTKTLKQELIEELPWLMLEFRFQIMGDGYDGNAFGNAWVTLRGADFFARFVRDRGQIWVEVASKKEPNRWWPLENVLETSREEYGSVSDSVHLPGELLRREFENLAERLGARYSVIRAELVREDNERQRRFMAKMRAAGKVADSPRAD